MRIRRPAAPAAARRYMKAAAAVLVENGVHVRRFRDDGEGYAYAGRGREIEAPRPRTAAAFAVLCHEVAHHALGHTAHPYQVDARRELEEEREAWEFTFACFARFGFSVPAAVTRQVAESMAERLAAALEEGLDPVPARFRPFEPAARALLAASPAARYNEPAGADPAPTTHDVRPAPP